MARRRRPAPAPPAGSDYGVSNASRDQLATAPGDEAVAVLVEDAFDETVGSNDQVLPAGTPSWAATVWPLVVRRAEVFAAWCLVAGEALWMRTRRDLRAAGNWASDAFTVVTAWTVATSVTLGLRTRQTWGVLRERHRQRSASRAASRSAQRSIVSEHWDDDGPSGADEAAYRGDPPPVTLREAALSAWGAQRSRRAAREAEAQRRRTARDANALRRLVAARLGLKITPSSGVVDVDGLRLGVIRGAQANDYTLVLLSTCPACGAPVASADLRGLADLGAAVDAINVRHNLCQECRTAVDPSVNADPEQLVATLREMLGSEALRKVTPLTAATHRTNGSTPRPSQSSTPGSGHAPINGQRDRGSGRIDRNPPQRADR